MHNSWTVPNEREHSWGYDGCFEPFFVGFHSPLFFVIFREYYISCIRIIESNQKHLDASRKRLNYSFCSSGQWKDIHFEFRFFPSKLIPLSLNRGGHRKGMIACFLIKTKFTFDFNELDSFDVVFFSSSRHTNGDGDSWDKPLDLKLNRYFKIDFLVRT